MNNNNSACERCKIIYGVSPCKHITLFNSEYGPDYKACPCTECLVTVMCDKSILCEPYVEWLMGPNKDD